MGIKSRYVFSGERELSKKYLMEKPQDISVTDNEPTGKIGYESKNSLKLWEIKRSL